VTALQNCRRNATILMKGGQNEGQCREEVRQLKI